MTHRMMARGLTIAALLTAMQAAQAAVEVITSAQLAAVPADSAQAVFDTALGRLTWTAHDAATLSGSDLFGYEGLWLGANGADGRYTLQFDRPLAALSLDVIALDARAGEGTETLASFSTDAAVAVQVRSGDGSAAWLGGALVPSEEDGRATLTLTAASPGGFTQWRFLHSQPVPLNGFVVQQVRLETLSAVPEPASAALWLLGAVALAGQRRRRAHGGDTPPRSAGRTAAFCVHSYGADRTGLS